MKRKTDWRKIIGDVGIGLWIIYLVIICFLFLTACKTVKIEPAREIITETREVIRNSIVTLPADSSMIRALVECDSTGKARIRHLLDMFAGSRTRPPRISIDADNILTAECDVDSYKLFGKSYIFKVAGVEYMSEWMEHVCENMSVEYVSEWIGHVCEDKEAVIISHTVHVDWSGFAIEVHSSKSVYSDLRFYVSIYYYPEQSQGKFRVAEATGIILAGNSHAMASVGHPENIYPQISSGISVSPGEDERYYYRKQGYNE
jgi:hypothetical protein